MNKIHNPNLSELFSNDVWPQTSPKAQVKWYHGGPWEPGCDVDSILDQVLGN